MKKTIITTIAAATMAVVSTSAASAGTFNVCVSENGKRVFGLPATMTDWTTKTAVANTIGAGRCGTVNTDTLVDPRVGGVVPSKKGTIRSTQMVQASSTVQVDAGRKAAAYNGTAPTVIRGPRSRANDRWSLVSADGNGGGIYRVTKSGNTTRPIGTQLHFTSQMLQDRDLKGGTCVTAPKWCRKMRYDAVKDVTTGAVYETTTTRTRTTYVETCPSTFTHTFSIGGKAIGQHTTGGGECTVKRVTTTYEVAGTSRSGGKVSTGSKYIPQ